MQDQAHVHSWYAASATTEDAYPPLRGATETDVCVIGGGYTGLSAAICLRRRGYRVTLLEANKLGWGASGRNGGHVGTGQRAEQDELEKLVVPLAEIWERTKDELQIFLGRLCSGETKTSDR